MEFDLPVCKQKWVWSFFALQIPKCASSSIQAATGERNLVHKHRGLIDARFGKHPLYKGIFDRRHIIPEHLFQIFKGQVLEFLSFCVVRNPIERVISSYYFGREKKLHGVYGLPENIDLNSYIKWLYENRQRKDILILLPQVTWAKNNIFPVEILRFEDLSKNWADFVKKHKINLPTTLPHENKSQHKDWREELSAESLKMLLDFTQDDYRLYPELYV